MTGSTYNGTWDNWYGPDANKHHYNVSMVLNSTTSKMLSKLNKTVSVKLITSLRKEARIDCGKIETIPCKPLEASCLFDIEEDPCELRNLAEMYVNKK